MAQMTVCQTCGDEGYLDLLIHCEQCQIVAVHRYCVDGPSNVDDDDVSWSCEDCAPRISQPVLAVRKSERISLMLDREVQRRKARRNWRNHPSVPKIEKSNCVGESAKKVANDSSNLDEKKYGIAKRNQGKLKVNGILSESGGSAPALKMRQKPDTRQKKKALNSKDGANKKGLGPSLLTEQKTEDFNNFYIDDEDMQKNLEMNLDSQLSNESEHCLEGPPKADEISDGDSVEEKWHKYRQSSSELCSTLLDEQQGIGCFIVTKKEDGTEENVSDNIEAKNVSASLQRGEKQSGFSILELQNPRKKRRLVIAMEYSDSEEEPSYIKDEHPQVVPDAGKGSHDSSSSEPLVNKSEYSLAQESFLNSDGHFPTQQSLIHSDNHTLPQAPAIDFKNHSTPQLPPVILDCYISAQPIINAIWRGHCSISNHVKPLSFGLEAHLSNKAHPKVHGAASALPNLLSFEVMQKHDAWPKRFEESPPMGDAIGLYFFPVEERDEKWFTSLLDEMIERDLALKSHINNLELLVFSSQELPLEERRFQSKYYLWGVFKQKQETSSTSQPSHIHNSDTMDHRRDLAVLGTSRSSVSPSNDNYSVINSSNSCLHHEAGDHVELTPISIKHPKPAHNEQGCNSHPTLSNSCKRQEHALGTGDATSRYHGRGSNLYKRNHEIGQGKPMRKWKDAPLRQSSHSHTSYRSAMC